MRGPAFIDQSDQPVVFLDPAGKLVAVSRRFRQQDVIDVLVLTDSLVHDPYVRRLVSKRKARFSDFDADIVARDWNRTSSPASSPATLA
jgi:hypothetical protein